MSDIVIGILLFPVVVTLCILFFIWAADRMI